MQLDVKMLLFPSQVLESDCWLCINPKISYWISWDPFKRGVKILGTSVTWGNKDVGAGEAGELEIEDFYEVGRRVNGSLCSHEEQWTLFSSDLSISKSLLRIPTRQPKENHWGNTSLSNFLRTCLWIQAHSSYRSHMFQNENEHVLHMCTTFPKWM